MKEAQKIAMDRYIDALSFTAVLYNDTQFSLHTSSPE